MAIAGLYECFNHWHAQGTVWIYSDPHFGDKDLAEGQVNRPNDETQIKNINSKVGKNDTLILLGDVGDIECAKRLKGYKILICGNHDIGHTLYKRQVASMKFPMDSYQKDEAILEMKRLYPGCRYTAKEFFSIFEPNCWEVSADNCLFDEVYTGPLMIGEKLILSHESLPMIPWVFNIHGHVHDVKAKNGPRHLNCCAEAINFTPVNFNQFMKQGHLAHIESIHRTTIDTATKRKQKRGNKKIGK